jgi:mRNA interferase HigB
MRIIKEPTLAAYAKKYARAAVSLEQWRVVARQASWRSLSSVRATYASADALKVKSGRVVTVFNIAGNRFRLVTAIHYNRGLIFILQFLTHAEYSQDKWKDDL